MTDKQSSRAASNLINAGVMWFILIILLAVAAAFSQFGLTACNSSSSPAHWRNSPADLKEMDCSRGGVIKSTMDINEDFEVLLVHNANDPDDVSWGALAHKQDNFKPGNYVQICYIDVLIGSRSRTYNMVGLAKRDDHTKYPLDSELEQYEQCREDLKECDKIIDQCMENLDACHETCPQFEPAPEVAY